jgi:hypothetical protein
MIARLQRVAAGRAGALLVLAAAWAVWLHRLGVADLDDSASNEVMFARRSLWSMVSALPWTDQSPLFFVVLHFWRKLGEDPLTIKTLNLVLLTASFLVIHEVARLVCSRRVALATVALAALSPASLWVVRNGRMYSLQLLLWVLCLLFMVRYVDRRRRQDLIAFSLAAALSIYNHFVGFVSTATALAWLALEALVESRSAPADEAAAARRRLLGPVIAAGVAVFILVQPQVMRLLALLQAPPPVLPTLAVPGGWMPFLDRMTWFWFMSGDWGALGTREPLLRALYLACANALFVVGLARGSHRLRRLALVTVVIPIVAIGFAAGHMDWRDRHLLYLLPLIWIAVANAAFGGTGAEAVRVPRAVARGAMAAFAVVAALSGWLLYNKLPERYPEWTRLMTGLARIYRPSMAVYMPPSNAIGMPALLATRLSPGSPLGTIGHLSEETRPQFLAEAAAGRDFVFLVHWSYVNDELAWRTRYLEGRGYHKVVVPAWGTHADVFTREPFDPFARAADLGHRPSSRELVDWARARLREPSRARPDATPLGAALVARADPAGLVRESTFFSTQHGEGGSWRLGGDDAVSDGQVASGGRQKDVLIARATADSLLLVALPQVDVSRGLRLTCGSSAPAGQRKTGVVSAEVFVDGGAAAVATCPAGRLASEAVAVPAGTRRADIALALAAVGTDAAEAAFRVDPGRGASAPPAPPVPRAEVVDFSAGRTLRDFLTSLTVYRTSRDGFGRVPARLETTARSAAVMHEKDGPGGEGGLEAHWALGVLAWDGVGLTRQISGGETRAGLWAHPKDGTTLVLEAAPVRLGPEVRGFYGFTDFSVETATALKLDEPIGFRVFLDGHPLLEREVPRTRGWKSFQAATPRGAAGPERLRIEIDGRRDDWAHFVFDLGGGRP